MSALRTIVTTLLLSAALLGIISCSRPLNPVDVAAYKREIEQWQANRLKRLTSETGWLTLCGLFWLREGENGFGGDSSNVVIFPNGKTPAFCGTLTLDRGRVTMRAKPGVEVRLDDSLVTTAAMVSDAEGDPTTIAIGTIRFYLIKRGEQLGVRVKDRDNPARVNFKGLEFFPIDPSWRIEATFKPYVPPKVIKIATMISTVEDDSCPGALIFSHDGKECQIDAVIERGAENQLFLMISDETSGKETYAVGRQLYTTLPDQQGKVILDFNKAYNWPCVFTEFATCPIPPRQNHLPFRVEAGEKMYRYH
jgi:uncharacterized protein (DUF1684 family)